jgi:hypothetical protein
MVVADVSSAAPVDLMIAAAAAAAVRRRPNLSMARTFIEYRRVKRGSQIARETTDFVAAEGIPENRVIPDAAFIIENIETERWPVFPRDGHGHRAHRHRDHPRSTRHAALQDHSVRPLSAERPVRQNLRRRSASFASSPCSS